MAELLKRIGAAGVSYRRFKSSEELGGLIRDDLAVLLTERFERKAEETGWSALHTKLPVTPNRLIGRAGDLKLLDEKLGAEETRILTLLGPGGVGKSRLAIELGALMKERFADGVHLVTLETLVRSEEVPGTIAASLGLSDRIGTAEPRELVLLTLAERELLLILDNFEHLIDAGTYVSELVAECPGVKVLVTSRTLLRLRGEVEYLLMPLEVPERGHSSSPAVELFLARARSSSDLDRPEQKEAIAEVCRRLDGLPLAIELAAARTSLLSPASMLERLSDGFDLLRGSSPDLPERQRTMRSTIAWSVDLLGEEDKVFFRRLAAFCGGFTLDAAEAVCDPDHGLDVLERMQVLVENSIIQPAAGGLDPRFRMLESIRQFALEMLDASSEADAIRSRHAHHFFDLSQGQHDALRSSRQLEALDLLEAEEGNFRGAMRRLLEEGRHEDVASIGWAVWPYWWMRGRQAYGRTLMEAVLDESADVTPLARERARGVHGGMCMFIGDYSEAVYSLATAHARLRELNDEAGIGMAQIGLGIVSSTIEGEEQSLERLREAQVLLRSAGENYGLVLALNSLCWTAMAFDNESVPLETYDESISRSQQFGGAIDLGMAIGNRARRISYSDPAEGLSELRRAMFMLVESDMRSGASFMVDLIAEVAAEQGEYGKAAQLHGFAEKVRETMGALMIPALGIRGERNLERLSELLGASRLRAELAAGAEMDYETGIGVTLDLSSKILGALRPSGARESIS
ncbi:MAG: hypothetical protein GEU71_02390 [Actinobacteria bacterium]|nr:hypothetical protein [Actinomycetota bacterium]